LEASSQALIVVKLFTAALFLSALLLFTAQPLLGRALLPQFGGTSSVWTICLLFYQGVLLLGYLYAHLGPRLLGVKARVLAHVGLLIAGLVFLPFGTADEIVTDAPVAALLGHLASTAFLPLFVLSASAPLLQRWFVASGRPGAEDPFFLYRASNLGSFIALAAYPFLIEPLCSLSTQRWVWMVGFGLFFLLLSGCASLVLRWTLEPLEIESRPRSADTRHALRLVSENGPRLRLTWLILSALPSSWLMGTTTQLTTDIAPVPLLWVAPLGLYLLSFVVAFTPRAERWLRFFLLGLPAAVLLGSVVRINQGAASLTGQITLTLLVFSWACLAFHGTLARLRPASSSLTEFYLWLAVGGLLGGLFNALLAPVLFDSMVEYPLVQIVGCLLIPLCLRWTEDRSFGGLSVAYCVTAAVVFLAMHWHQEQRLEEEVRTIYQTRNFYGALRVVASPDGKVRRMIHGNVVHGVQITTDDPRVQRTPLWYFFPTGPAGNLFTAFQKRDAADPVAIIGLGAGSLAAYARPGQEFTFYELNPAVLTMASRRSLFSYLEDSPGKCSTILGDARLMLRNASDSGFGLLVVDAFNSDAIPIHLLTREAFELYLRKLRPDGLLLFHVTNDYLDLAPVLAAQANDLGLAAIEWNDVSIPAADVARGKRASHWVLMARHRDAFSTLALSAKWQPLIPTPGVIPWTDDYSSVFRALK
jgi:hypothetical protein